MQKDITLQFEGGRKLAATVDNFTIRTDLPEAKGGENTAPNPFQLFLASLGTCACVYAQNFFLDHEMDMTGFDLVMHCDFHNEKMQVLKITYDITLPANFPQKYVKPLLRTIEHCTVKNHLHEPPEFEIRIVD